MVKFATNLHQKSGVIATTNGVTHSPNQKQKKVGNLNLQPTTVHIQVQQGKNGQQHISLQPNDFAGSASVVTSNDVVQGNNGVISLQSPSHHKTLLATQNIKIQQSPTNIQVQITTMSDQEMSKNQLLSTWSFINVNKCIFQVYAQQLGRPGDSPKVIKASPSMQQVLLTSLATTSPVGNRTTTSFSTVTTTGQEQPKRYYNRYLNSKENIFRLLGKQVIKYNIMKLIFV